VTNLPQRLPHNHTRRHGDVERPGARLHGDGDSSIGGFAHLLRHAGGFAAEEQDVVRGEGEFGVGGAGFGGEEDNPARAGGEEFLPGGVADEGAYIVIIQGDAAQALVIPRETAGLDDVQRGAHTGGKPNQAAGILGDVGLK